MKECFVSVLFFINDETEILQSIPVSQRKKRKRIVRSYLHLFLWEQEPRLAVEAYPGSGTG